MGDLIVCNPVRAIVGSSKMMDTSHPPASLAETMKKIQDELPPSPTRTSSSSSSSSSASASVADYQEFHAEGMLTPFDLLPDPMAAYEHDYYARLHSHTQASPSRHETLQNLLAFPANGSSGGNGEFQIPQTPARAGRGDRRAFITSPAPLPTTSISTSTSTSSTVGNKLNELAQSAAQQRNHNDQAQDKPSIDESVNPTPPPEEGGSSEDESTEKESVQFCSLNWVFVAHLI